MTNAAQTAFLKEHKKAELGRIVTKREELRPDIIEKQYFRGEFEIAYYIGTKPETLTG